MNDAKIREAQEPLVLSGEHGRTIVTVTETRQSFDAGVADIVLSVTCGPSTGAIGLDADGVEALYTFLGQHLSFRGGPEPWRKVIARSDARVDGETKGTK